MAGHNKWKQIKNQKAKTDAQKSKAYSKHARLISVEVKKSGGMINTASVAAVVEKAKKENVPKDVIDRALKKGTESGGEQMDSVTYEAYGPGGCAIVIEGLTANKNKAAQEVKHILSKNGYALAGQGAATWAFTKKEGGWIPNQTMELSENDLQTLDKLVEELEDNDEVQEVFTNVE